MAYHPFRHLGLKFLSIALAVAVWLAVGNQRLVERSLRVPLEFHDVPAGLEIVSNPPDTLEVRLRGPSNLVARVVPGEAVAVLNLESAREGTRLFHVLPAEVRVPYGVQVAQVNPSAVSLTFERSLARDVPVRPAVEGEPAAGYTIGRISSQPAVVRVVGPASRIAELKHATTEPVSVARAKSNVVDKVTVGVDDPLVRIREVQAAVVTVEVLPRAVERRLEQVSVAARNTGRGRSTHVIPSTVAVVLRGTEATLSSLGSVEAYVDVAALGAGRYQLPVRVGSVGGIEVIRTDPAMVDVRIR
jgi:YbbR domain-containing protein